MKSITPALSADRDSRIPHFAAQDWEQREARAAKIEAAEIRQKAILESLELAPHFELHRLPQNFWVAQITQPMKLVSPPLGEMPKAEGANLPPLWDAIGWSTEISGCTDLHPISDHILFFRSNLPEQEIRENIDLSFLPY